jgi:hypothetical protein
MQRLEAVNRILRGLGDPPVPALDTGGTSDAGEAETFLNESDKQIQTEGWAPNTQNNITVEIPDTALTATGGTGTFTYGSTITQATSLATMTFYYEAGGIVYGKKLNTTAFTTTVGHTIASGAVNRNVPTAVATITSAKHVVPSSWLMVRPGVYETREFYNVGGFLYDPENNTDTFSTSVKVDRIVQNDFTTLPEWLAEYIVANASVRFQRYKRRGVTDDQMLLQELQGFRMRARKQNQEIVRVNILKQPDVMDLTYRRQTTHWS